jgi:hypothetical protein
MNGFERKAAKSFMAFIAAIALGLTMVVGCASFGVWSTTAQTDIATFQTWADQWVGGAVSALPAIIAAAAPLVGGNSTLVLDATAAVAAAQGAVSVVDAVGSAANSNTATANQAAVVQAFQGVNSAFASVKAVIAAGGK